jgi:hypothetical protein
MSLIYVVLPVDGVFVPLVDVGDAGGGAHDMILTTAGGGVVVGVGIVHSCHTASKTTRHISPSDPSHC